MCGWFSNQNQVNPSKDYQLMKDEVLTYKYQNKIVFVSQCQYFDKKQTANDKLEAMLCVEIQAGLVNVHLIGNYCCSQICQEKFPGLLMNKQNKSLFIKNIKQVSIQEQQYQSKLYRRLVLTPLPQILNYVQKIIIFEDRKQEVHRYWLGVLETLKLLNSYQLMKQKVNSEQFIINRSCKLIQKIGEQKYQKIKLQHTEFKMQSQLQITKLNEALKTCERQNQSLSTKLKTQQKAHSVTKDQLQLTKDTIQKLNKNRKQKLQTIGRFQKERQQNAAKLKLLYKNNQQSRKQICILQQQINEMLKTETRQRQLREQKQHLQSRFCALSQKLVQSEKNTKAQIIRLQNQIQKLSVLNDEKKKSVQLHLATIDLLKVENEKFVKQNQKLKQQNQQIQQRMKDRNLQVSTISHKLNLVQQRLKLMKWQSFFQGDTLNGSQDRRFLTESIQNYTRKKLTGTSLLYRLDQYNQTNFHKYIDQHPNTCAVIRTSSGWRLAAFVVSPFKAGTTASDQGIIISISKEMVFQCSPNRRASSFDDYYLIWGHSEVRLRTNERKVFSNFGITNSYYQHKGAKVDTLLGTDQRETPLLSYQIFRCDFE